MIEYEKYDKYLCLLYTDNKVNKTRNNNNNAKTRLLLCHSFNIFRLIWIHMYFTKFFVCLIRAISLTYKVIVRIV